MPRTWTKEQKEAHSKYMRYLYKTEPIRRMAGLPPLTNLKVKLQRKLLLISEDDLKRWANQ